MDKMSTQVQSQKTIFSRFFGQKKNLWENKDIYDKQPWAVASRSKLALMDPSWVQPVLKNTAWTPSNCLSAEPTLLGLIY